jgi:hypothetical protein
MSAVIVSSLALDSVAAWVAPSGAVTLSDPATSVSQDLRPSSAKVPHIEATEVRR